MSKVLSRVGPGIMLAATAVGVSHLVYSTQAGGNYGFSLVWLIVLIVLLKYPAFRFAVEAATDGRGEVEFRDVSFGYEDDQLVLRNINESTCEVP